jgi:hypothetical protein
MTAATLARIGPTPPICGSCLAPWAGRSGGTPHPRIDYRATGYRRPVPPESRTKAPRVLRRTGQPLPTHETRPGYHLRFTTWHVQSLCGSMIIARPVQRNSGSQPTHAVHPFCTDAAPRFAHCHRFATSYSLLATPLRSTTNILRCTGPIFLVDRVGGPG